MIIKNDKIYDTLHWLVTIVFPAVGAFYAGLAALWGFPYGMEVVGTMALVATLIGTVVGIAKIQYDNSDERFDGSLMVEVTPPGEDNNIVHFNVDDTDKDEVTLKVGRLE